jgi:hypothetical protein
MVVRQMFIEPCADGGRLVPEVPADAIRVGTGALVSPLVEGRHRYTEELGHLVHGEQTLHRLPGPGN